MSKKVLVLSGSPRKNGNSDILKFYSILLFAAMMFAFTACGGNSNTQPPDTTPRSSETTSQPSDTTPRSSETTSQPSDTTSQSPDTTPQSSETPSGMAGSNILVAYFSRVGNTDFDADVDAVTSATLNLVDGELVGYNKIIADMIVQITGGDLFLIQTEKTYPSEYTKTTDVAMDEQKSDARPELLSHVENMEDYDIIILGYPNWWGTIPQAMFTFLEEYDFSGKTIIPFATHEGSGLGSGESDIKKLCPDATILDGLAIRGGSVSGAQEQVKKWLEGFDILK